MLISLAVSTPPSPLLKSLKLAYYKMPLAFIKIKPYNSVP